jgi:hypothetical protein
MHMLKRFMEISVMLLSTNQSQHRVATTRRFAEIVTKIPSNISCQNDSIGERPHPSWQPKSL